MIALVCLTVIPFLYLISLSLSTYADTYNVLLWPRGFHWRNYLDAWQTVKLGLYARNSIYVTALALIINLAFGSMAAYGLARYKFPLREPLYNLFVAGLILSGETLLVPLFLNLKQFGMLDHWWTLPVVYATIGFPFTVFNMRAFFETLPSELIDSAQMDGCNAVQAFAYVMLPLSRSALVTTALFQFVWFWDDFILAFTLISSQGLQTIPAGLANLRGEYFTNYPVLAAALTLTTIPIILVFVLTQRQLIRGMTGGAIK
jgi:ABC-type glycerol-3-phosphate transport system permease component